MATYTENYNLTMPAEEDYYNVADYNENFETIDTLIADAETATEEINNKIGTPENGETIFSLLKNCSGIQIKSIQHIKHVIPKEKSQSSVSISAVDSTKCIVLYEILSNGGGNIEADYTLTNESINLTHSMYSTSSSYIWRLGFWIIEFC